MTKERKIGEVNITIDHTAYFGPQANSSSLLTYACNCVSNYINHRMFADDEYDYTNDILKCRVLIEYKRGYVKAIIKGV